MHEVFYIIIIIVVVINLVSLIRRPLGAACGSGAIFGNHVLVSLGDHMISMQALVKLELH
jgi:hypothetical protein